MYNALHNVKFTSAFVFKQRITCNHGRGGGQGRGRGGQGQSEGEMPDWYVNIENFFTI
jgi:hypothetical protein